MAGRKWTAEEEAYLVAHWRYGAAKRIARRLGRTAAAVSFKASKLGCALHRKGEYDQELLEYIRTGNAAGLLDTALARRWNELHPDRHVNRRSIAYLRKDILKLPVPEDSLLESRRRSYQTQLQTLRVDTLADVNDRRRQREARSAGWPAHCTPMQVKILDLMEDGEYRTREEIAAAIGQAGKPKDWFKCRRGSRSSLFNLVRDGLLAKTSRRTRRVMGKGSGYSKYEYYMPIQVLLEHRQKMNRRRIA